MSWASGAASGLFGRRATDPTQEQPPEPPPWPEFAGGPHVYEGQSVREVVPALSEFSIEIQVDGDAGAPPDGGPPSGLSVFYEFSTEAEEGFGFSGAGKKGNMGFAVELVSRQREEVMPVLETAVHQSHLQVVRGEQSLPRIRGPCTLRVVFDNTHSIFMEKKLSYHVVVATHRNIRGRDSGSVEAGGAWRPMNLQARRLESDWPPREEAADCTGGLTSKSPRPPLQSQPPPAPAPAPAPAAAPAPAPPVGPEGQAEGRRPPWPAHERCMCLAAARCW